MTKEDATTNGLQGQPGSKKEISATSNQTPRLIFYEDPGNYEIRLTKQELAELNKIIKGLPSSTQAAHKEEHHVERINSKYTLLFTESGYYLVGEGRRKNKKNSFLDLRTDYGSTAKMCIKLEEKDGDYILSNKVYTAKKHNAASENREKEIALMQKIYGLGEIIFTREENQTYLIMPKIPGQELGKLDFKNLDETKFKEMIVNTITELVRINAKKILHNNLNPYDIFYDKDSQRIYFSGFGAGSEVDRIDLYSDSQALTFTLQTVIDNYLLSHITSLDLTTDAQDRRVELTTSLAERIIRIVHEIDSPDDTTLQKRIQSALDNALSIVRVRLDSESLQSLPQDELVNLMFKAIKINDEKSLKEFLPYCNEDTLNQYRDREGMTLLQCAEYNQRTEMINDLLEAGASPTYLQTPS
ncbi:Uncharacterised protein [Legionella lansingensis]|uniref:Protein kinase domain-containing protein n=1 Tax=Legionella lansingensis TaxID=45067 RepID=A0A0W0VMD6_9GAMM|nr:serine/threonine-protein kinase [Legionella lansingensis]KTD20953.1 hypothetical protein Llan_1683 [Legionella lansingensis]SNV44509.1 Uncharacterised protein [Legionella lansingensis]